MYAFITPKRKLTLYVLYTLKCHTFLKKKKLYRDIWILFFCRDVNKLFYMSFFMWPPPIPLSAYHFTSRSTIRTLLIISHSFPPPSFQHLVLRVLCVIIAHYNVLSVSSKKLPKTAHALLNQPWETFWRSREGKQGVERENEWRSWENYFIASGEVILHMPPTPFFPAVATYRMSSIKIPPPICSGFAPRYKVFPGFHQAVQADPELFPSQNPIFQHKRCGQNKQEGLRGPGRSMSFTQLHSPVWGGLHLAVKNGPSGSLWHFLRRVLLWFTGPDGFSRSWNCALASARLKCFPV